MVVWLQAPELNRVSAAYEAAGLPSSSPATESRGRQVSRANLDRTAVGLLDDVERAALAVLNAIDDAGAGATGVQLEIHFLLDGEGGHGGSM